MSPSPIGPPPGGGNGGGTRPPDTRPPAPPTNPVRPVRPRSGLLPVAELVAGLALLDKGRRTPRPPARHPAGRSCAATLIALPLLVPLALVWRMLPAGRSPERASCAPTELLTPRESARPGSALSGGGASAGRAGGWPARAEESPPAAPST